MNSPWHLDSAAARLQLASLSGSLDLARPGEGIAQWRCQGRAIGPLQILGIDAPWAAAGDLLQDRYVRGSDLAAVYRESSTWPVRVDALWHVEPSSTPGVLAVLDLVLSVRTEQLDSRPVLAVRSVLPAARGIPFQGVDRGTPFQGVESVQGADRPEVNATADTLEAYPTDTLEAYPMLPFELVRLAGSDVSYAQMVYPTADTLEAYPTGTLEAHPTDTSEAYPTGLVIRHRLFPEPLEKGVILRSRVRGVLLDRQNDAALAAECFAAFSAAEPPLGT